MSRDTWSTFTVCRDDTRTVLSTQCAAGIDLHHLFKSLSSTHTCLTAQFTLFPAHRAADAMIYCRGGFWSCLSSFCIHLRNPSPFISEFILFGRAAAQIRGENLRQVCVQHPNGMWANTVRQAQRSPVFYYLHVNVFVLPDVTHFCCTAEITCIVKCP